MSGDLWDATSEAYRSITAARGVHLKMAIRIGVEHKENVCKQRSNHIIDKLKLSR